MVKYTKKLRSFDHRSQKLSNVKKIRDSNRKTVRQEIIEYWYGKGSGKEPAAVCRFDWCERGGGRKIPAFLLDISDESAIMRI
jgi:hypothetical protein